MAVIILTGYMGSGKTTIGKKLARRLDYSFIDADTAIEKQAGYSISRIFEKLGEATFRQLESDFIATLVTLDKVVVATGGGMPCFGDNMQRLNAAGITVYLHRLPGELAHRLIRAKNQRPLIAGKNEEELQTFIAEHLSQREVYYRQAKYTVDRNQQSPEFIYTLLQQDLS